MPERKREEAKVRPDERERREGGRKDRYWIRMPVMASMSRGRDWFTTSTEDASMEDASMEDGMADGIGVGMSEPKPNEVEIATPVAMKVTTCTREAREDRPRPWMPLPKVHPDPRYEPRARHTDENISAGVERVIGS
jgi:hypothetical protein